VRVDDGMSATRGMLVAADADMRVVRASPPTRGRWPRDEYTTRLPWSREEIDAAREVLERKLDAQRRARG
jgi:hypothetical protein